MKVLDMKQRYLKFKRSWGMGYAFDTVRGNSVSLKTRVKTGAVQKVTALNEIWNGRLNPSFRACNYNTKWGLSRLIPPFASHLNCKCRNRRNL